MWEHCLLTGVVLSHHTIEAGVVLDRRSRRCEAHEKGGPFWCRPSRSLVDQIFYGEFHPHQASLSDIRVIMTFMFVLMVESICQVATRWISALKCVLSDVCGSLWLRLVLSGFKWPCRLRMPTSGSLAQDRRLLGDATRGLRCVLSRDKKKEWYGSYPRVIPGMKRTGSYADLLGHNQRPSVPGVQDTDK
jgi:hypothetical protein